MRWMVRYKRKYNLEWYYVPCVYAEDRKDEAWRQARIIFRGGVYDAQVVEWEPTVVFSAREAEAVDDVSGQDVD